MKENERPTNYIVKLQVEVVKNLVVLLHSCLQARSLLSVQNNSENCRRGMSYASIGKKLGTDPSKEELLSVYKILKEVGDDLPKQSNESV